MSQFFVRRLIEIFFAPKNIWAVTTEMRGETHPRPHVQCLLLLPDFNQNGSIWKKKFSLFQRFSRCCKWTDARTIMAKLIVKFWGTNGEKRLLTSSCLSVRACLCPHVSLWLSLTGHLGICNLRLTKICRIPNLVKIEQQYLSGTFILLTARRSIFSPVTVQREPIVAFQWQHRTFGTPDSYM